MVREILKNHASRSWQCLAGYSFYPTDIEQLVYLINGSVSAVVKREPWLAPDVLTGSESAHRGKQVNEKKRARLKNLLEIE